MNSNSRLDRFLSRLATASTTGPAYEGEEADLQRIVFLAPPIGNVVGRLVAMGKEGGRFFLAGGEVRFRYTRQTGPGFYVNRGVAEFQAAASLFNAFTWSMYDPEDDECECFEEVAKRLQAALEKIEPLGDPAASLWAATIHDAEGGLWTLC